MKHQHGHGRGSQPDATDAADWFAGRLPQAWFDGDPDVAVDREEITVIGRLPDPFTEPSCARARC